jgi:hypothetical protein
VVRDRRWDFLYERQKQPVKEYVLERFAELLAQELRAWPPAGLEWESEAQRARWGAGAAGHPRDEVIRLALEAARLDLARDFEALEALLAREPDRLPGPADQAARHLLTLLVTESCLELKERADRLGLTRADLCAAVDAAGRLLFRVSLE